MSVQIRKRKRTFSIDAEVQLLRVNQYAFDRINLFVVWTGGANGALAIEFVEELGTTPSAAVGFAVAGLTQAGGTANQAGKQTQVVEYTIKAQAIRLKYTKGTTDSCVVYCKAFTSGQADVDGSIAYEEAGTADTNDGEIIK